MQDLLRTVLKGGLQGKNTHIDPLMALKDLKPEMARKKDPQGIRSCWDLLHHVVVWQEAILRSLEGEKVDWRAVSRNENWPTGAQLGEDQNWEALVTKFTQGIETTQGLLETIDFQTPLPALNNQPALRIFLILLQHNSYHFGHLVALRKQLGDWPMDLQY